MTRDRHGFAFRLFTLATFLVFAGCSGVFALDGFRETERDRRTFQIGHRASARVVSVGITRPQMFFGKTLVTTEKHSLSLRLEGKDLPTREFEVGEEDFRAHPLGSTTVVLVEEDGRFLPEFRREALLSAKGAGSWMVVALLSGVGFLMGIAELFLYRKRVRSA